MRAVLQRVERACVRINSQLFSATDQGLLVFVGVEKGDTEKDADIILEKTVHLRIFEDEQGKMNRSLADIAGEMLVVSQFTLLADCDRGEDRRSAARKTLKKRKNCMNILSVRRTKRSENWPPAPFRK